MEFLRRDSALQENKPFMEPSMEKLIGKLQRRPLREEIYESLKNAIIQGEFESDETLYEEQLAKKLGISRTPIREAIFKLEQQGLIIKSPRGGFNIPELSTKEIEEIFGLRLILEIYAAELVVDQITDEGIHALEENVKESEKALAEHRPADMLLLNSEFHDILHAACDSKWLHDFINRLRDHITRHRARILKIKGRAVVSIKDHKMIIDAIKNKDRRKLKQIIRHHINTGKKYLLKEYVDIKTET